MDEPPSSVTVVDIRNAGRGTHRLVTLSDGREFVFSDEAITRTHLTEGCEVTAAVIEALESAEHRVNAHDVALRLLSHRPRSQSEMRTRLAMRGIDPETIEQEIERLERSGLLNDQSFAEAWVESRQRNAPRGRRMLRFELLGRGIDPAHVSTATDGIDDLDTAVELATSKARGAPMNSYEAFLGKVGPFLQRRGFDFEVAAKATRIAWEHAQEQQPGK
jgi:regulatory protein